MKIISKLQYNNNTYTISQLIQLRNLSPLYKKGDVSDLETGECLDIQEIDKWRDKYFNELIPTSERQKILDNQQKYKDIKVLEKKYSDNIITKDELLKLIQYKNKNYMTIQYDSFFMVNAIKNKPKKISITDYGRFMLLLDLMSYDNQIKHTNGRKIKESVLLEKLEIKTPKSLTNFISRLSKEKMLAKAGYSDKRFIHINPVYAHRTIKIDQTIYDLFSEDLKEYLSEYEIKYFEMNNSDEYTPATIEIIDG